MKTITRHTLAILFASSPALAAGGAEGGGNGLLVTCFLGFGALILVGQIIPGLMLFGSMIKELFCKPTKAAVPACGNIAKIDE
jgi:hypothetical protein